MHRWAGTGEREVWTACRHQQLNGIGIRGSAGVVQRRPAVAIQRGNVRVMLEQYLRKVTMRTKTLDLSPYFNGRVSHMQWRNGKALFSSEKIIECSFLTGATNDKIALFRPVEGQQI